MNDYPISQLRIVALYMKGEHRPSEHICHQSQVDQLVKASIRLHHTHGNPHALRNGKTKVVDGQEYLALDNLWEVRVKKLSLSTNSYWWCHDSLSTNNHPNGAQIHNWDLLNQRVWAHPDLLALEESYEDLD